MRRERQIALTEELLDLLAGGTTAMASEHYVRDASAYRDPARFARELDIIFRRTPLLAGLSSDLPDPGDFMRHDDTGVPILIVRKEDGSVGAYANICRHRGSRLVEEPCGKGRAAFSCPYHGWTYNLEGALSGIPYKDCFNTLDRATRGLAPMPVAEKFGMIFVAGTPGMTIDLDAHLGPLGAELASWDVGSARPALTRTLEAPINWKLALDTFTEGYHFSVLHKYTIARLTPTNVMAYERMGQHYRLAFPTHTLRELRAQPRETWEPLEHLSCVYYMYPNVSLNVTGSKRRTVRVFRIVPGRNVAQSTTIHTAYTAYPIEDEEERKAFSRHFDYMHGVIRDEDYAVQIGVQQGLAAGLPSTFVYGRNEPSLIDMHREYDRVLAEHAPVGE